MTEKWAESMSFCPAGYTPQQRREMDAQRVLAPSPTVEERARIMREAEADTVKLNETGLTLLERRIAEQSAIIAGQRTAIEALREMVEGVAQGHRHLAGRIDKVEQELDWKGESIRDIYRQMGRSRDKLDLARMNGDEATYQRSLARDIELEHRVDGLESARDCLTTLVNKLCVQAKRVREQFPSVAKTEEDSSE